MNAEPEEAIAAQAKLWEITGEFSFSLIILVSALFISGITILVLFKSKRQFAIWLLEVCISVVSFMLVTVMQVKEKFANQCVEAIVTTPVESGNEQGTQPHA